MAKTFSKPITAKSSNVETGNLPTFFQTKRHEYIALVLIFLGAILRLIGLGSRPFWFDETISVYYARQDVPTLFILDGSDNHPVGYYLTLKGWIGLFGESEVSVRLLSTVPGLVALWLVWLIAKQLFPKERRIGLVAVGIMSVSPFQIYFSQEARNYSFMEMWVLATIWFWLRGLQNNRWSNWFGFAITFGLGLAFNLTTAFYVAPLFLVMLTGLRNYWQQGRFVRFIIACAGGSLLASLALIPKLNRLQAIKGNFWVPTPDLLIVMRTFYTFIFGAVSSTLFVPAFALAFIILVLVMTQVGLKLSKHKWLNIDPDKEQENSTLTIRNGTSEAKLGLTTWLLFGPLTLIFVFSLLFQSIYLDKALIGCAPFYYLLIGWTLFQNGGKNLIGRVVAFGTPVGLALLLGVICLPQLYNGTINPLYIARYDASSIDKYIAGHFQTGDGIASATDISLLPLIYYDPSLPKYQVSEYPYPNVFPALLARVDSAFVPEANFANQYKRLWVVFEVNPPEEMLSSVPRSVDLTKNSPAWLHSPMEQQSIFDWFNAHYARLETIYLDRVLIVTYQLS